MQVMDRLDAGRHSVYISVPQVDTTYCGKRTAGLAEPAMLLNAVLQVYRDLTETGRHSPAIGESQPRPELCPSRL